MELDFVKLHGLGNDFVVIDDLDGKVALTAGQVSQLCDRAFGIGADGVILVRPSARPECRAYMHYINSDGTLAQMCGNGVRCFAKFLVDRGLVSAADGGFVADTLAGPRPIRFVTDEAGRLVSATVNMGAPILEPSRVPVAVEANDERDGVPCALDVPLDSPYGTFRFSCVSMGNPHAVCFIDDMSALPDELFADPNDKRLDTLRLDAVGAHFESAPEFPEKTNVEFAEVREDGIAMRVFERGCGETLACGTGACATQVAAYLTGRSGREGDVMLRGGTLHIMLDDDGEVLMTGPAEEAFTGTVAIAADDGPRL